MNLDKLAELLAKETYPHRHIHKLIGRKTEAFLSAVAALELAFPALVRMSAREAPAAQGAVYLALTYEMQANSADEIIKLYDESSKLPDLKIIL